MTKQYPSITRSNRSIAGGCQCGAIRYLFSGTPQQASLCHCRMCQKAGGGFGLALVRLAAEHLLWTRGVPSEFRSSPVVARGFCSQCGTPLYMREDGDSCYEITIGSLDDPNAMPPQSAVGIESKWHCFDTLWQLPSKRTDEDRMPEDMAKLVSLQYPGDTT